TEKVCEAPLPMLLPMIFLAVSCLALGFGSRFVTARLLGTALAGGAKTEGASPLLTVISVCVLALAVLDHYYGFRKTGNGLSAADHFHYAPVLHGIYGQAEKKRFDPYHLGGYVIRCYAAAALYINDAINRFYDKYLVSAVSALSKSIRKAHNGNQAVYISWVLLGIALVTAIFAVSV
ncbi:MAG: hypothetical protein Q8878_02290, partial [Bacillota bacterium]|nr:hypothetical protein [Bacillota bacterium]